jgi:hypothetical protein
VLSDRGQGTLETRGGVWRDVRVFLLRVDL